MEQKIEIVATNGSTSNEIGKLLENVTTKVLQIQGFEVVNQVRLVGSEVDLLCRHKISGERIYVECKAFREPNTVAAPQLRQLLGTVQFERFSAGWLLTSGNLSKDAKGFVEVWKDRSESERRTLRVYEQDHLIQLLVDSKIIVDSTRLPFSNSNINSRIRRWTLLLTNFGNYWAATIEDATSKEYVTCFNASDGSPATEVQLRRLKNTNTSLNTFEFKLAYKILPALEAYTSTDGTASEGTSTDPSVEKLIYSIRRLPGVMRFDIQTVERFRRKGMAITLELEGVGLFSALGSNIRGALNSLSSSMPLPKHIEEALGEIAQAMNPIYAIEGMLNVYVPTKTYLVWPDYGERGLESIIPIKLDAALDESQAITSAIIIGSELFGLRVVGQDTGLYEHSIWVEDEDGKQWLGDIDLKSSNPIVSNIVYQGMFEDYE